MINQNPQDQRRVGIQRMQRERFFHFQGTIKQFEERISQISTQQNQIQTQYFQDVFISLVGKQQKPPSKCCMLLTLISTICVIPIIIKNYSDCWKQKISGIYKIQSSYYKKIHGLLNANKLSSLKLIFKDNYFNTQKASIIYDLLIRTKLKKIYLKINATTIDYQKEEKNYTDFQSYIKPIKDLQNIHSTIIWEQQI